MRSFNSLKEIFEAFKSLTVLVVGDVMIDSYIWGKSSRLSPEAPVPIVNVVKNENRLGGAANVALNIQSLGATALLCSVIGDDINGGEFIRLMEEKLLSSEGVITSPERTTTIKQRVISGSQHLLRIDSENDHDLSEFDARHFVERYAKLLEKADVVIFEDYDKGLFSEEIVGSLIALANEKGIPSVVDPKKKNFLSYKNCTLFKPNLKELKEGIKADFADANFDAIEDAAKELKEKQNIKNLLITLSERGVLYMTENESGFIDAHVRSISDVSGAGDTVVSIAALCLALELPLEMTAGMANLGGGLVCEHIGVVPINKDRLYAEAKDFKLFEEFAHRVTQ